MKSNSTCLLIIENDENIAVMLSEFFHLKDYEVVLARSGDEGWRTFVERLPNAVILSGELPDIPGLALAEKLIHSQFSQPIPVVLITDQRRSPQILAEAGLRPEHQIIKPFDLLELGKLIDTCLAEAVEQPQASNHIDGALAVARLEAQIDVLVRRESWAILKISIINLPIFTNALGPQAQQDLLSAVRTVIMSIVVSCQDFGCQMLPQPTDSLFIVVVPPEDVEPFTRMIKNHLTRCFDYFHRPDQQKERLQVSVSAVQSIDRPVWDGASLLAVLLQNTA